MNKRRMMIALALAIVLVISGVTLVACDDEYECKARRAVDNDNAELRVFFDDFEEELDTDVWNVHHEIRKGGYWDSEQAFVEDGNLVLRTVEKDGTYFSGAIDTMSNFERVFGYYEARCYLPKASGIWSAFWLMPKTMPTPSSDVRVAGAEIDIMESPYYNPKTLGNTIPKGKDTYQCAVHVGDYHDKYIKQENLVNSNRNLSSTNVSIYDGWHTFGLDWTKDYYRFYFDRQLVYEIADAQYISTVQTGYLFLSVEVGGANGVATKPPFVFANGLTKNPEGTFPVDFLVDYVAVYSKRPF